jgi:hypothetical protein
MESGGWHAESLRQRIDAHTQWIKEFFPENIWGAVEPLIPTNPDHRLNPPATICHIHYQAPFSKITTHISEAEGVS